jgi:hypothetical protein
MNEITEILERPLELELPYTDTQLCYDALGDFPSLARAFNQVLRPAAQRGGPLPPRLAEIEQAREQAYEDLLAERGTLREAEWPFDCCIADLYYALFDSLTQAVNASELSFEDRITAVETLDEALHSILAWDTNKRFEISFLLVPEGDEDAA